MSVEEDNEEYFAAMKQMFQSDGWQYFIDDLRENVHLINDLQMVTDEKDLFHKKGKLDTIGLILNFPETIKRAEEDLDESPQ
jgi:competence protein ComGF